jgi:hypothetical protein
LVTYQDYTKMHGQKNIKFHSVIWFNFDSMLRASSPGLNMTLRASHSILSIFLPSSSPSMCSYFVPRLIVNFSRHFSRHLTVNILDITPCCLTVHYLNISLNVSKWIISIFCPTLYDEYSYSTTNKMRLLCQIIYSCTTLYMFRPFRPLSGAQNCVYSNGICQTAAVTYCYRGWDAMSNDEYPRYFIGCLKQNFIDFFWYWDVSRYIK